MIVITTVHLPTRKGYSYITTCTELSFKNQFIEQGQAVYSVANKLSQESLMRLFKNPNIQY